MSEERMMVAIGAWDIAKIVALLVIIVGLWFLPSFVHLRQEYVTYFEIIGITPAHSVKDYVERGFDIYGSWETDVRITGSYSVQNPSSTRMYVMDLMNYNFYQLALPYQALYVSEVRTAQDFNIPIPPSNGKETTWYLVFQNPNNQLIFVTCRAGVNYERAFLGHPYTEWISRACIVIALSCVAWVTVTKRYVIRIVPGYGIHIVPKFDTQEKIVEKR